MRIVLFTSNSIRHKFVANTLAKNVGDMLVISECKESDSVSSSASLPIREHFMLRYNTEMKVFRNNEYFISKTIPLMYKEANLWSTYKTVKNFNPDLMVCFGSSILKGPILSLAKKDCFINLHLGLSPYYRGSGTNFYPFINNELEYIGSTLLHLDSGIDTGDIICHVRPRIEKGDNVHTIGCKVISDSVKVLIKIISMVKKGFCKVCVGSLTCQKSSGS